MNCGHCGCSCSSGKSSPSNQTSPSQHISTQTSDSGMPAFFYLALAKVHSASSHSSSVPPPSSAACLLLPFAHAFPTFLSHTKAVILLSSFFHAADSRLSTPCFTPHRSLAERAIHSLRRVPLFQNSQVVRAEEGAQRSFALPLHPSSIRSLPRLWVPTTQTRSSSKTPPPPQATRSPCCPSSETRREYSVFISHTPLLEICPVFRGVFPTESFALEPLVLLLYACM